MPNWKPYPTDVGDYERLPQTVAGLHFVAFACLMLNRTYSGSP